MEYREYARGFKQYRIYRWFIEAVKKDQRAICFGPDYVVVSKNVYDDWMERLNLLKKEEFKSVEFDELKKFTEEDFEKIMKELKK